MSKIVDARPRVEVPDGGQPDARPERPVPDLPAALRDPFLEAAQRIATAMKDALGAQGSFVAINNTVSQSVPHLHVHVVPRTKGDGLRGFFWPRTTYGSDDAMAEVAERIRAALRER